MKTDSQIEADYTPAGGGRPLTSRWWFWPLILVGLSLCAVWVDGPISRGFVVFRDKLGGDPKRELEALQQYGQFSFIILVMLVIWTVDAPKRVRLLDYGLALALTGLAVQPMKMLIGRPRPRFEDPMAFMGPFGTYELNPELGPRHAWEFWTDISSDLWSMPSSHTAFAVVMSVFLALTYPKLRPLAIFMAGLVAFCRLLFGAHYPSDVLMGAAVAIAVSVPVIRGGIGRRWLGRGGQHDGTARDCSESAES